MNEEKVGVFPKIWDRSGERKIIGETKVSWLVEGNYRWESAIKIPKKDWNKATRYNPRWFTSEQELLDCQWADANSYRIGSAVQGLRDPAMLRQIAELIGYSA